MVDRDVGTIPSLDDDATPGPIYIVDDEPLVRRSLSAVLRSTGHEIATFASARETLDALAGDGRVDLIIADVRMPGMDGVEMLREAKRLRPDVPVLMLTGAPDTKTAIEALKVGAAHYLIKPVHSEELLLVVERTMEATRVRRENQRLRRRHAGLANHGTILWQSSAMAHLMDHVDRLADIDATVLITGENGTGKELLANYLHHHGNRSAAPFVPVNCGAIPTELLEAQFFGHRKGAFTGASSDSPGLFREAHGGTLFLDEVGDLPRAMQVKLLRAIETRDIRPIGESRSITVDVRIIAATNRDLDQMVRLGEFRQDLFYRLNVFHTAMPPLRERGEDIALLARFFLRQFASRFSRPVRDFTPKAIDALMSYAWPGNVRELSNVVQRALVLCGAGLIDEVHLQLGSGADPSVGDVERLATSVLDDDGDLDLKAALDRSRRQVECRYIRRALQVTGGNRTRAAVLLGISYRSLLYKINSYGDACTPE